MKDLYVRITNPDCAERGNIRKVAELVNFRGKLRYVKFFVPANGGRATNQLGIDDVEFCNKDGVRVEF